MKNLKSVAYRFTPKPIRRIYKRISLKRKYDKRKKFVLEKFNVISSLTSDKEIELIFIMILDCLRKTNLSLYGNKRKTTPFLDKFCQKSAIFTNSISPSNWTYPSVVSILSGLYPHNHGAFFPESRRNFSDKMLPRKPYKDVLLLQDILPFLGFDTHFISSIATAGLPVKGTFMNYVMANDNAYNIVERVIENIEVNNSKKFFYVQLGELHQPIYVPEKLKNKFGKIKEIPNLENWEYTDNPKKSNKSFVEFRDNRILLYDSGIYYLDSVIKRLVDYLEKNKKLDKSIIIITSDHGEEFWEHKDLEKEFFYDPRGIYGCGHGHHFFQEIISIPLIIYGSNIGKRVIKERVSLVDIVPTILNIIGVNELVEYDGENVFNMTKSRLIVSEENAYGYERLSIFFDKYKMIYSPHDRIKWFFDLVEDPEERDPKERINPSIYKKMNDYLENRKKFVSNESVEIDKETKEQLSNLGYF